jgi:hypothetical protein
MARCEHGFERSVVPCSECGDRDSTYRAAVMGQPRRNERRRERRAERQDGTPRRAHPGFMDLTGQEFAGAVVLERAPNNDRGSACWRLRLPCGHERVLPGIQVRSPRERWTCHECGHVRKARS